MSTVTTSNPISTVVLPVSTWNPPLQAPDSDITYIDLSSVDNEHKAIVGFQSLRGKEAPSRARQIVKGGDIIVSTVRPNLNGVAQVPQEFDGATASTGFCVLRPDGNRVDARYLFHWTRSPQFVSEMVRRATGASYPAVSDKIILESGLPLPPLAEQRRIAAILDAADALRQKRRQALRLLHQLSQAIFIEMFGDPAQNPFEWPIGTIGDLLESASYGTSDKANGEGALPILRMNNLTYDGRMDLADLKYIDLPPSKFERYIVRDGDILFNRTNSADLVGKTAVYRGDEPMAFAGYLVRLRTNERAAPDYISAFLNSRYGKAVLRGMCKSIIGMANINAAEVQSIQIPCPPAELQVRYSKHLKSLDRQRASHAGSSVELDALFTSLQHRAFRGEL